MTARGSGTFDVVVIGSGLAGCSAALAASCRGLRVAILEKSHLVGGVSAYSSGLLWIGNNGLREDSPADVIRYLEYLSGGMADSPKMRAFAMQGRRAFQWLREDLGWPLWVVEGYPDMFFPQAPGSREEGRVVECDPFDVGQLGSWRPRLRDSPYDAPELLGAM